MDRKAREMTHVLIIINWITLSINVGSLVLNIRARRRANQEWELAHIAATALNEEIRLVRDVRKSIGNGDKRHDV